MHASPIYRTSVGGGGALIFNRSYRHHNWHRQLILCHRVSEGMLHGNVLKFEAANGAFQRIFRPNLIE